MGRSNQQPYMYDAPKSVDSFDPRAFSRKSWAPSEPPKPKKEGPLLEPSIEYNKHPDSYVVEKYGKVDAKPMGPSSKKGIKWSRWVQLGLRMMEIVGAAGVLICAICIKGMQDAEGWIIRIPPGVDMLATLYAIYHLCRAAKARTPMSSASYHFFAAFVDAAAIPFYIFNMMLTRNNAGKFPETKGRWRTFFSSVNATNSLFQATWLAASAMAALHFFSLAIDLYLVIMFRKICNMPPDMNPLEDNLTSRPKKSKHKYKDSDATLAMSISNDVKRASDMSDSSSTLALPSPDRSCLTLAGPNRNSQTREPLLPDVKARNISFFHTRTQSATDFNPHNPRTARMSQIALDEKNAFKAETQSLDSGRKSHLEGPTLREPTLLEIRGSLLNDSAATLTMPAPATSRPLTGRDSRQSIISSRSKHDKNFGEYTAVSLVEDDRKRDSWFAAQPARSEQTFGASHNRRKSQYDFESDSGEDDEGPAVPPKANLTGHKTYQAVSQENNLTASSLPPMRPLGMNPPSPLHPIQNPPQKDSDTLSLDSGSHYSNATNAAPTQPQPSHDRSKSIGTNLLHSATPRGKYYGDLASATQGIRRGNSPSPPTPSPPRPTSHIPGSVEYTQSKRPKTWFGSSLTSPYDTSAPLATQDLSNPNLYSADRNPYLRQSGTDAMPRATRASPYSNQSSGKGVNDSSGNRVVSTGAEYKLKAGTGGRRREVSGKVAEEGRGGSGWGGYGGPGGWGLTRQQRTNTLAS